MAFDRRRGGGQDHRKLADGAAYHGHIARLIVHAVVLLEAGIVLFVDDDEAEIGVRQEQRRARTDHDTRFARRGPTPEASALGGRQRRVPFDGQAAEARLEAAHELAGERDLGQHDQRLPALLDRACDGLEINLRLAGARDAIEQRDGEIVPVDRRDERVHRARLVLGEFGDVMLGVGPRRRFSPGSPLRRDCRWRPVHR